MAANGAKSVGPFNVGKCLRHRNVALGDRSLTVASSRSRTRRVTVASQCGKGASLSRRRRVLDRNWREGVASLSRGCGEHGASRARSRRKIGENAATVSTFSTSCRKRGEASRPASAGRADPTVDQPTRFCSIAINLGALILGGERYDTAHGRQQAAARPRE